MPRSRSNSPAARSRSKSPRKSRRASPSRSRSRSPPRRRRSRSASRSRSRGRGGGGEIEPTKLYVGNLSFKTKIRDLEDEFGRYGRVKDVFMPLDNDNRPRGFAFVSFESERDADDAVDDMDDRELDGRVIRVNKAKSRGGDGPPPRSRGGYGGGKENCRDYERGNCSRGSSCRFEHSGGSRSRSRSRSRDRRRGGRSRSR